jgi:hypothetical protein
VEKFLGGEQMDVCEMHVVGQFRNAQTVLNRAAGSARTCLQSLESVRQVRRLVTTMVVRGGESLSSTRRGNVGADKEASQSEVPVRSA